MKKTLLSLLTVCAVGLGYAQSDIIAVSGSEKKAIDFQDFRFLDINSQTEKVIAHKNAEIPEQVVGMTYDAKNQKLIFIGMHSPDIFSYDLNNSRYERIYATGRAYSKCALGDQFSRMATNSKGISYALNNNSTQLIEITPTQTGYAVTELGKLSSDFKIDQYKFYGGDLIADNEGNLFLISANRHVVKINPATLQANFIGVIEGIEKGFTTNGSAVLSNGEVLLTNALGKGYYTLDFNTLKAKRLNNDSTTAIYDLASPYLLNGSSLELNLNHNAINIYPSKITNREVSISLNHKLEGMGVVRIYDIAGNELIQTKMNLSDVHNVKTVGLNQLKPGNYYVKVIDAQGTELINEKIILLR